jgi:hypothetical protein
LIETAEDNELRKMLPASVLPEQVPLAAGEAIAFARAARG